MELSKNIGRKEPPPLRSEVARAIRQTASRKATCPDDVLAELFKAGGETALDRMHSGILSSAVSYHASISNLSICASWTSKKRSTLSRMISS